VELNEDHSSNIEESENGQESQEVLGGIQSEGPVMLSPTELRNLERTALHQSWTSKERELICVLRRWYTTPGRGLDWPIYTMVFNSIFQLDLRPLVLQQQYGAMNY
jgi:hypothetical protein